MGRAVSFSVGIPTFNQAGFLEEMALPLLNQTPEIIQKYFETCAFNALDPSANLTGNASTPQSITPKIKLPTAFRLRPMDRTELQKLRTEP